MTALEVFLVFDAIVVGVPLASVVLLLVRRRHWRRLANAADRAQQAGSTSAGETVAHGVVEVEDGVPPIEIEIDEHEYKLSGGGYQWTETARRVRARPFMLRTRSGELIQINADHQVLLDRPLDRTETGEARTRTRKTALQPGEQVYVVGIFEPVVAARDPYREGATRATMRAPRRGRITISTSPLRERFERHATYLASKALGVVYLTLGAHSLFDSLRRADLDQIRLVLALLGHDSAGAWVQHSPLIEVLRYIGGFLCAGIGIQYFFTRRDWNEGKLIDDETVAERRAARTKRGLRSP
jgi:hypothetical protein